MNICSDLSRNAGGNVIVINIKRRVEKRINIGNTYNQRVRESQRDTGEETELAQNNEAVRRQNGAHRRLQGPPQALGPEVYRKEGSRILGPSYRGAWNDICKRQFTLSVLDKKGQQ
jgi:hypothetical protein